MNEEFEKKSISGFALKHGMYSLKNDHATMLDISYKGVKYSFFVRPKTESQYCVIFGTGAINKKKVQIPYFDRLSWYQRIPCSVIYYFDPTLYLNERINLGWLYGNNSHWYMEDVNEILKMLLKKMGIVQDKTLFVGSSGGGFTSCVLATLFKSSALVYNPQLICRNWSLPHIEALETVLNDGEQLI